MKIVFMGTPSFSVPILEALNEKYEVVMVVSQPNQLGKKKQIIYTPVAEAALKLNLNLYQPLKLNEIKDILLNTEADVLVTAAYGQFVSTSILKHFKKCINVHGSLLPKRRGGAPIQRSIMEGDSKTGITIMEMVKGMDAGRIYAKRELSILDSDNNESLFNKLSFIGRDLLLDSIEDIYNGINEGVPQDVNEVTISPNIKPEEEEINFDKPARKVFNQIRGLSVNPGAYFIINNFRIKVLSSRIVEDSSCASAGTIILAKKKLIIKCGSDAIELIDIKPEGKGLMNASNFLNGQHIFKENEQVYRINRQNVL